MKSVILSKNIDNLWGGTFANCTSLENVYIPENMEGIDYFAFYNCISLEKIYLPDNIWNIGPRAFENCKSLKEIHIPKKLKILRRCAFAGCSSLNLTLPDSVQEIGKNAFTGVPNVNYNGTASGSPWGVRAINGVKIPTKDGYIEIELNDEVFRQLGYDVKRVEEYIEYFDFEQVTLLKANKKVKKMDIPSTYEYKGEMYKIVSIGKSACLRCESLKSVKIPNSVRKIEPMAFDCCFNLEKIDFTGMIEEIGELAFFNCDKVKEVNIPYGITKIENYIFGSCKSLTKIVIPNSVTEIGDSAFYYCENLKEINIPDSVTKIGEGAFGDCSKVKEVNIPYGITKIESYIFASCESLTKVVIPNSVIEIEEYAFAGCTSLNLTVPDSVKIIGENAFLDVPNVNYSGTATGFPWGAKAINGVEQ